MLKDIITSKTRIKLLELFFADPKSIYHVREIVRRVEEEINAVRRELIYLEKKGIFQKEARGNRVCYYLDPSYPYFYDLVRLQAKSNGLGADIIKNRVKLGRIKYAMLSGKFVRNIRENPDEVDLLIVGTVVVPELALIVKQEEARRGSEINYTVMSEEEFIFRKKRLDPFISSLLRGSRLMLLGDEESMLS